MRAVVGLGNPGSRYAATRHNLGFMVLDTLAGSRRLDWSSEETYRYAVLEDGKESAVLVKPMTYMNDSGLAVSRAVARFGAAPDGVFVLVDDVHLPLGRLRIRRGGSHGGHNGLRSIIQDIGTEAFPRLRMGVGPVPEGGEMIDFVLEAFGPDEQEGVSEMVGRAADAVCAVLCDGIDKAMNEFNR